MTDSEMARLTDVFSGHPGLNFIYGSLEDLNGDDATKLGGATIGAKT